MQNLLMATLSSLNHDVIAPYVSQIWVSTRHQQDDHGFLQGTALKSMYQHSNKLVHQRNRPESSAP
jgi:hypothetical protein